MDTATPYTLVKIFGSFPSKTMLWLIWWFVTSNDWNAPWRRLKPCSGFFYEASGGLIVKL